MTVTVTEVSCVAPDVVMLPSANRVFPLRSLITVTRVWSAVLNASTREVSARASSRDKTVEAPDDGVVCIMPSAPC